MAIQTLCMRPSEYEDVRLFVPRAEYEKVKETLVAFLDDKGVKRRPRGG